MKVNLEIAEKIRNEYSLTLESGGRSIKLGIRTADMDLEHLPHVKLKAGIAPSAQEKELVVAILTVGGPHFFSPKKKDWEKIRRNASIFDNVLTSRNIAGFYQTWYYLKSDEFYFPLVFNEGLSKRMRESGKKKH